MQACGYAWVGARGVLIQEIYTAKDSHERNEMKRKEEQLEWCKSVNQQSLERIVSLERNRPCHENMQLHPSLADLGHHPSDSCTHLDRAGRARCRVPFHECGARMCLLIHCTAKITTQAKLINSRIRFPLGISALSCNPWSFTSYLRKTTSTTARRQAAREAFRSSQFQ